METTRILQKSIFTTECCEQRIFSRQPQPMREFEKLVLDTEAHEIFLLWRYRIVPHRSYVKGWKVSPSHYVNQDLGMIWLDR
jgi:peptide/nickel transport system substrate-binding protein